MESIYTTVSNWVCAGKTSSRWSENTMRRVTQGLLSTLRDFGILQGAVNKRLAPFYLPIKAFAYIAFYLRQKQASGEKLICDPEWRLFFLSDQLVERFFIEAHQEQLLLYHAAGPIVRIDFPTDSIEEYAYALVKRSS